MRVLLFTPLILFLLILAACAAPPAVIQGNVISYDSGAHVLSISDETAPEKVQEFSIENADIGADPNPGDVVRVAYYTTNGKFVATRVMNISRQKDLKTGK